MSQGPVASGRCAPAWPKDVLRITFGVIWLIDATLKWLPGFRASYMSTIMAEAQGQPAPKPKSPSRTSPSGTSW